MHMSNLIVLNWEVYSKEFPEKFIKIFQVLYISNTHTHTHTHIYIYIYIERERERDGRKRERCRLGVMFIAMDCGIVVSEFVLQSRYNVYFRANTQGKGMNPLILPAMG